VPTWLLVVLAVLAIVLIGVVVLYNRLVRARVRADQAWAQVDTQLQRRHDLIPNLVATVQGYAGHERAALEAVTAARAAALAVRDPADRAAAEDELGAMVARLLLLAEAYPALQADQNFQALASELSATEDRIAFARGFANDRVRRYRELITTFPGVVVARPFGFRDRPMFDADGGAARAPSVDLES
jgi:LemA protein